MLHRLLQLEAQALTRGYVEAHGGSLTAAVCGASAEAEWRDAREPRAPRAVCGAMLAALAGAREETLQLIDSSVLQGSPPGQHDVISVLICSVAHYSVLPPGLRMLEVPCQATYDGCRPMRILCTCKDN